MKQFEKHLNIYDSESLGFLRKKKAIDTDTLFLEGSTMSFHHINYHTKMKTGYFGFRKHVQKQILLDVSGIMKPGLNAILGPTGSGKSSLLDILATRKNPKGLSGDILINGFPLPPNFKCISGYVVQDDVVMGTLTVRENLEFSAALRLPLSMSIKEKDERVNTVIKELDLSKVADSKVGTYFIRGVSGGERKRTCIGLELITHPTVLFLDEPTTGLDASTANAVLLLLKKMSEQGRTIIFSIHQPRYSIYKLFDSLTLLAAGRLLYHGPCENALPYFKTLGYVCEPYNNPADFFLDVINGDSTAVGMSKLTVLTETVDETGKEYESIAAGLAERFSRYGNYKALRAELDAMSSDDTKKATIYKEIPYSTPFFHQLKWASKRTFKNLIGNPQNSTAQICIATFMGIILGAVFAGVKNDATGIQNRHEYISGYYRVSAYFFSKIIADMVPMRTLPGIILTSLNYFTIGFKPTVAAFFIMMITVILVAYTASSMALAVATGQDVTSVANLLINICFVFMIVFSGLLVNLTTISPWLLWLKYFSIPRYGLNALQINEFIGLKFCKEDTREVNITCIAPSPFRICTGEQYLKIQGINFTFWGMLKNYVALTCMTIIFLTIAYLKLRFLKKYT
ncbi:broad substrate specificity ATP-binding cassette transporter ABCG2-like isoform X3 [Rhineura floridana]|uniref:broad substrate specificity ATP-binding cassette transporter ABCG2-like isoform X3 n=1 Tax=Rhineura floridana TaxID=261503 RepID=UPI002AC86BCF|nr:broad substrate specificity ATP-binding cassette transporter ABCG2-like isoform X3 [Rhineura floridana]